MYGFPDLSVVLFYYFPLPLVGWTSTAPPAILQSSSSSRGKLPSSTIFSSYLFALIVCSGQLDTSLESTPLFRPPEYDITH